MHSIRIYQILAVIFFLFISCSQDKKDFELAEKEFNNGNIVQAEQLYEEFLEKYPTSKWRLMADGQLDKCKTIVELEKKAEEYETQKEFDKAKEAYLKVLELNKNAIDTSIVFSILTEKIKKYEEELREIEKRKIIELQKEQEFLSELAYFGVALPTVGNFLIFAFQQYDALPASSIGNIEFAKGIGRIMNDDTVNKLIKEVTDVYLKIKNPPPKHLKCFNKFEKSYIAFKDLIYVLNHLENYSRYTLRSQVAELAKEIARANDNKELYFSKELIKKAEERFVFPN